ncbi:hypothetical protein GDO86_006658 [Hymenochirus boettgeri]|uniref:Uncharacterized protein n=1 Tax=Hymenochirus boettgeri TaxID=247094 RepID=A0A8T2JBY5_9PIPI|nr:hypothetical protein GDO86_006658 [Hymenochirus boettgeri]
MTSRGMCLTCHVTMSRPQIPIDITLGKLSKKSLKKTIHNLTKSIKLVKKSMTVSDDIKKRVSSIIILWPPSSADFSLKIC